MLRLEVPNVFFDILNLNNDDLMNNEHTSSFGRCHQSVNNRFNSPPNCKTNRQSLFRHFPSKLINSYIQPESESSPFADNSKPESTLTSKSNNNFTVNLDLTEFDPKDISIKLEEKIIVIQGKHEFTSDNGEYELREYVRKIPVPDNVLTDQLKSTLNHNGQLIIQAPLKKPVEDKENKSFQEIPIEFVVSKKSSQVSVGDDIALD